MKVIACLEEVVTSVDIWVEAHFPDEACRLGLHGVKDHLGDLACGGPLLREYLGG
jgi:hypothetical protein